MFCYLFHAAVFLSLNCHQELLLFCLLTNALLTGSSETASESLSDMLSMTTNDPLSELSKLFVAWLTLQC